jgi:hypothetical protein
MTAGAQILGTDTRAQNSAQDPCPAHAQEDPGDQTPQKHCQGLCLCLHVSLSPTLILAPQAGVFIPSWTKIEWDFSHDRMTSVMPDLLQRPPQITSLV